MKPDFEGVLLDSNETAYSYLAIDNFNFMGKIKDWNY